MRRQQGRVYSVQSQLLSRKSGLGVCSPLFCLEYQNHRIQPSQSALHKDLWCVSMTTGRHPLPSFAPPLQTANHPQPPPLGNVKQQFPRRCGPSRRHWPHGLKRNRLRLKQKRSQSCRSWRSFQNISLKRASGRSLGGPS